MTSMHRQLRVIVALLFISALLAAGSARAAPSQNIIYVDHEAVGNNDGSSWTDAYTDLQDALGAAQEGGEIWVAQGVYYPAPDDSDRTATFELVDGVELYGGFAGTEAERDERDWEANVTVLSGDLDQNDVTDPHGVVTDTANITGTNAYHVVTGGWDTDTPVFDGFVVTAGNADGADWPLNSGGGMYNDLTSPTLTSVTFMGNYAQWAGGGMYNYAVSCPTLTNVTFTGNRAGQGGGMYSVYDSNPTLTDVSFSGNEADNNGGGMGNLRSNAVLTNVTFSSNYAEALGGGMHNRQSNPKLTSTTFVGNRAWEGGGVYNDESNPVLTNVTFSGNKVEAGGGAMYNWSESTPTLVNCILWGNEASTTEDEIYNLDSTPTISYSDIEGGGGSDDWDADLGIDGGGNIDADPLFIDPVGANEAPTTAGDYRLTEGSPAVDAGSNEAVPPGVESDLDGKPRIVDGTGDGDAVVDMGAYEFQGPLRKVYLPLVLADH